jgi:DNA (cytosine-5)-methyltransferase 1
MRQLDLTTGLIIDNFAGGGGASTGIELALGRSPDIAVNHDPEAIAMHEANHPATRHLCGNVWDVDPVAVCQGKPVALAWFSPDCKHHSKAKGGKPRDAKIRGLAWVVVRWARTVKPKVIMLENVEEFADWGPLLGDGSPNPARKGWTFKRWVGCLEKAGYVVETRRLRACDYGAPTTRRRLFIIARSDGQAVVWPEPTHGPGRLPYRTAAECIDWQIPCPSIFNRKKPLAEKTLRRIARGIRKFVLENPRPFIVPTAHAGDARVHSIDEPVRTICGQRRGDFALVVPTLIQTGYGERKGQSPRSLDLHMPLGTVVGCGQKHALVSTFLAKHYGCHEGPGTDVRRPVDTITARDHHTVVAAHLTKFYGTCTGSDAQSACPTITASGRGGGHLGIVTAFLKRDFGQSVGSDARAPACVVTAGGGGHLWLVASTLIRFNGDAIGQRCNESLGTVTSARRFAEVRAFLLRYWGESEEAPLTDPIGTVTTKDRFGLVYVHGEPYAIADIGMRMLSPRELFRAQGFSDDYVIDPVHEGKPLTKTAQIRMCGNSVCPPIAAALVAANVPREQIAVA